MRKDVFKRRIGQRIAENNPHHELVSKFDTFLYHSIFVVVMNDGFVWLDTHKVLHLLQGSNYKRSVLTYSEKFNWMLPLQWTVASFYTMRPNRTSLMDVIIGEFPWCCEQHALILAEVTVKPVLGANNNKSLKRYKMSTGKTLWYDTCLPCAL